VKQSLNVVRPVWLQVPDEEKRQRANYVIDTGCSLQETEQQVGSVLQQMKGRQGTAAARLLGQPDS
jgi:dephospho-CoA kinase